MLTNGITIPITAFLIGTFTTRQLFVTALGFFTAGSFILQYCTHLYSDARGESCPGIWCGHHDAFNDDSNSEYLSSGSTRQSHGDSGYCHVFCSRSGADMIGLHDWKLVVAFPFLGGHTLCYPGHPPFTHVFDKCEGTSFSEVRRWHSEFCRQQLVQLVVFMGQPLSVAHQVAIQVLYGLAQADTTVKGIDDAFVAATILKVIALLLSLFLRRRISTKSLSDAAPAGNGMVKRD